MPPTPECMVSQTFHVIDLFAGVGGIRLGVERAARKLGHDVACGYACDVDRFARITYALRHRDEWDRTPEGRLRDGMDVLPHLHGDVRTSWMHVPTDFDLLLGGFPCQPFSLAGVSKKNSLGRAHGLQDEDSGTLFDEILSILEDHAPPAFLLENVRHLTGHRGGETFGIIRERLNACAGGAYSWRIRRINSKSLVPQSRERVYFVGYRRDVLDLVLERSGRHLATLFPDTAEPLDDSPGSFWFPDLKEPEVPPRLADILHDHVSDPSEVDLAETGAIRQGDYTLSQDLWAYLQGYRAGHASRGNGFGYSAFDPTSDKPTRTLSARYHKDGSEILVKQWLDDDRRVEGRPRKLTPRECARLMGFADDEISFDGVSRTQAYRQMGNSVVVPVIEAIAGQMLEHLALLAPDERQIPFHTPLALDQVTEDDEAA